MKKIILIAFAFAAFSNMASAQQAKVSPTMTPPPSKEQLEKDNNTKAAAVDKASVHAPKTVTDANRANYKKAGLNDTQIADVEKSLAELDQRKAAIESNKNLTAEQKKNGLTAIEAERNAVLRKSMGDAGYKRYTIVTQTENSKAKPAKKATAN